MQGQAITSPLARGTGTSHQVARAKGRCVRAVGAIWLPKISWFGGHMARTVRELKDRLRLVDLVLEVRDARIPLSSSNPELNKLIRHKRRMIVLNKADLAAPDKQQAVRHALQDQGLHAVFTSTRKAGSMRELLQQATSMVRAAKPTADVLMIMTVGIPNSGKSSVIDALRHAAKAHTGGSKSKAATGATPGLTRHIAGFQVGERPTTFIMDTPGVMLPHVPDEQTGLRLALTGAIKDSIVGAEALVKHLLWELAHQPQFAVSDDWLEGLANKLHAAAVPSQVSGQKDAAVKKSSIQSAVETAVRATKQLQAETCAQNHQAQQAAATTQVMGASAIHVIVGDFTGHAAGLNNVQVTEANTTSPQGTAAGNMIPNANGHRDNEVDKAHALAEAAERKQQVKRDQVNTGLDHLHRALRLDVLDVDRLNATYQKIIEAYRTGKLGRYTLDM